MVGFAGECVPITTNDDSASKLPLEQPSSRSGYQQTCSACHVRSSSCNCATFLALTRIGIRALTPGSRRAELESLPAALDYVDENDEEDPFPIAMDIACSVQR